MNIVSNDYLTCYHIRDEQVCADAHRNEKLNRIDNELIVYMKLFGRWLRK